MYYFPKFAYQKISFSKVSSIKYEFGEKGNFQTLYLLENFNDFNIFEIMPKYFTISTNNGSSKFNTEMLLNTSLVITQQIEKDPTNLQYHLDIDDEKNVLQKFEQIYQGKFVVFNDEDILTANKIINTLSIEKFPNLIEEKSNSNKGIIINNPDFIRYLKDNSLEKFTIKTNKKEYKCNIYGILASKTLQNYVTKYPFKNEFVYDFDDEFNDFQLICDIFNFKKVKMTTQNKDALITISDDLQIEMISKKIDFYIQKCENFYEKVDIQQESIESIEKLFYLLYHIKEKTVQSVKMSIIQSFWCQTVENVQELAAFIIQVVNTDFTLHPYLADLLYQLDKEAYEDNNLNLLVPYIIKILKFSFGQTTFNCSFVYNLFKKGFLSKSDIINFLKKVFNKYENENLISYSSGNNDECKDIINNPNNYFQNVTHYLSDYFDDSDYPEHSYDSEYIDSSEISANFDVINILNLYLWFLPEIIEIDKFVEDILDGAKSELVDFINSFLPDKIEDYKKMRDKGEPADEITMILRNDDVDKLQSIISNIQNPKLIVPFNIYENFVPNGGTDFLNYSAAYGSIKCFKYLLLNYIKCDASTFNFAVYGGNIEIIKIVDYQKEFKTISNDDNTYYQKKILKSTGNINNNCLFNINYISGNRNLDIFKIVPAIVKHNDELFDWIFEQKILLKKDNDNLINFLIILSAYNGNVHSFIKILNNDFYLSKNLINIVYQNACGNGFYRFSKIIFKTFKKSNDNSQFDSFASIYFGNLSIFKFSLNLNLNQMQLEKAFILSVFLDHRNIINYFFDKLLKENFKFSEFCIRNSINVSVMRESSDLFFYLIDKFNQTEEFKFDLLKNINQIILENACLFGNVKIIQKIFNVFFSPENKNFDFSKFNFTALFFKAMNSESIELCQFLIDSKIPIDFVYLTKSYEDLSSVNERIISLILRNCNSIAKQQLLHFHLIPAITNKKYEVVELMLKENASNEAALIKAVQNEDLKMVKLILKYKSEPSFINVLTSSGTALCIAANKCNLEIIKVLLSIPGIDPNLYDKNRNTPLMIVFPDLELMEPFLNFYGNDFVHQTKQIHFILKEIFRLLRFSKSTAMNVIERLFKFEGICFNDILNDDNLLCSACDIDCIELVKMLLNLENTDLNVQIPETFNTPLIIAIINENIEIAKLLINDKRTNINIKNSKGETALLLAASHYENEIIDLLLNNDKLDYKENNFDKVFVNSNNKNKIKIIELNIFDVNHLLFTEGDDIFHSNHTSSDISRYSYSDSDSLYDTYTDGSISDHTIIEFDDEDEHNNDSDHNNDNNDDDENGNNDNRNDNGDDDKVVNTNVDGGGDGGDDESNESYEGEDYSSDEIEAKKSQSILFYAVQKSNIEIIDFVIQNPSFDKEKSDLESSIFKAIKDGKVKIFRKLLKLINKEINEFNFKEKSILCYSVYKNRIKITKDILNHPNFDSKKSKIIDSFFINLEKLKPNSYEIMNILYEYDKTHDNLINLNELSKSGETVFTSINFKNRTSNIFVNIDKIVPFLIDKGADPNKPNKEGRYPFQWAIDLESLEFVLSLINSNKIDFTKRIKSLNNSTFLHLAAVKDNPLIFKELLNRNIIDINSKDDLNETPLFYTCRFFKVGRIKLLFKRKDLDYLHRNNENLDIIGVSHIKKRKAIELIDKDSYRDCFSLKNKKINYFKVNNLPNPNLYPDLFKIDENAKTGLKSIFKFVDNSSSIGEFMDSTQSKFSSSSSSSLYSSSSGINYNHNFSYNYEIESLTESSGNEDDENKNKVSLNDSKDKSSLNSSQSNEIKKNSESENDKNKNNNEVSLNDSKDKISDNSSSHIQSKTSKEKSKFDSSSSISNEIKKNSESTKSNHKNNNEVSLNDSEDKISDNSSSHIQSKTSKEKSKFDSSSSISNDDNENKKNSESFDTKNHTNHDQSKLPPLHPKTSTKSSIQNQPHESIQKVADNKRDEISLHPLNKQKSTSNNITSPKNKITEPQNCSSLHIENPSLSTFSTSTRSKLNRVRILQSKSDNGDVEAQYSLGLCYSLGQGVPVDKEKALHYYLMSAEKGHISAQFSAASCFSYGRGTEVNKEKAFQFYLKAAEQGLDKAQFAVGHFYEFGQGGVQKNHEKAVEWYQKAAKQGHKGSINALNFKP